MRFFIIFTLCFISSSEIFAEEYTIQIIVAKEQKTIDTVRKMVVPCKLNWHSYTNSNGYKVLTCGKYSTYAAAAKDIELTRKAVPDAYVSTIGVSKKPTLKQEQKSVKTPVAQKVVKTPLVSEPKDKPKIKEVKKVQDAPIIKEAQKSQDTPIVKEALKAEEAQDVPSTQTELIQTPLRLININPEVPAAGEVERKEIVETAK